MYSRILTFIISGGMRFERIPNQNEALELHVTNSYSSYIILDDLYA